MRTVVTNAPVMAGSLDQSRIWMTAWLKSPEMYSGSPAGAM